MVIWGGVDVNDCGHGEPARDCARCAAKDGALSSAIALVVVVLIYGYMALALPATLDAEHRQQMQRDAPRIERLRAILAEDGKDQIRNGGQ